jgi:glycosyltransferase involved in cell wall biosynthesis
VSILMRTQGRRNELLTEALYSAYAQTCDDYEVVLGFHNPDDRSGELRAGVERLLGQLPAPLRRKVRLIACDGEGRGAPLNTLLEAAEGRYASFLDDDDLLLEHHVETLVGGVREHGEHVLFQTFAAQRLIDPVPAGGAPAYPYTTVAMSIPWNRPFDPIAEHHHNLVPICCMAVPTRLIRETDLRFRLDLEVGEDWDFWMGASQVLRVVVLPEVTTVVNHWNDATSNAMRRPDVALLWQQVRDARHRDHAAVPLLLDGSVRTELQAIGRQPEELAWLRDQLAQREARLKSIQRSRAWRLSELLWWASGRVRGGLKRARRR